MRRRRIAFFGVAALGITGITVFLSNGPRSASAHSSQAANPQAQRMRDVSSSMVQYEIGSPQWPLPKDSANDAQPSGRFTHPSEAPSNRALEFPAEYAPR